MDRILPDSGGVAKTMMESSLADFMQEVGYGFCARLVGRHDKIVVVTKHDYRKEVHKIVAVCIRIVASEF